MAEAAGGGVAATGLVSARHRRRLGRSGGDRLPLAGAGSRQRPGDPAGAPKVWSSAQAVAGPEAAHPRVPLAWGGGLWLSRSGLDLCPHRQVIEEEFGVRYHKDHVGRLLRELRWTPQVPIRRAIQR